MQEIPINTSFAAINFDPATCSGVLAGPEEPCPSGGRGCNGPYANAVTINYTKGSIPHTITVTPVPADTDATICAQVLAQLLAGGINAFIVGDTTIYIEDSLSALSCNAGTQTGLPYLHIGSVLNCFECAHRDGCLVAVENQLDSNGGPNFGGVDVHGQALLEDIDPQTGAPSNPRPLMLLEQLSGSPGSTQDVPLSSVMGLEYYGPGNYLYTVTKHDQPSDDGQGYVFANLQPDALYRVDRRTGRATLVGHGLGITVNDGDLSFDTSGTLYGVASDNGPSGMLGLSKLFKINLTTGFATDIVTIPNATLNVNRNIHGLAFVGADTSGVHFIAVDSGYLVNGSYLPLTHPTVLTFSIINGNVISGVSDSVLDYRVVGCLDYDPGTQKLYLLNETSIDLPQWPMMGCFAQLHTLDPSAASLTLLGNVSESVAYGGNSPEYYATHAGGFSGVAVVPCGCNGDLMVRDTALDDGTEPDPDPSPMFASPAIYVRNQQDGLVLGNTTHQNPEYRNPALLSPNYVYVIVNNRGCEEATCDVEVYSTQRTTGGTWPTAWQNYIDPNGLILGEQVDPGNVHNVTVAPGSSVTVELPWYPQDPGVFHLYYPLDPDPGHWCLLARLVNTAEGMTYSETADHMANIRNNNNIAMRNTEVVDLYPGYGLPKWAGVGIRPFGTNASTATLTVNTTDIGTNSLFNNGALYLNLGRFWDAWVAATNGVAGRGYLIVSNGVVQLLSNNAYINIAVPADSVVPKQIALLFVPSETNLVSSTKTYKLNMVDDRLIGGTNVLFGGVEFVFNVGPPPSSAPCVGITCPTNLVAECRGRSGTPVNFSVAAYSTCGTSNVTVVCTPPSGTAFPLGITTVLCSAWDGSGNSNQCSFTVTVQDTTPPMLICGASLVVASGSAGTNVTFPLPIAYDLADTNVTVVCTPPSGSLFLPGTHTVQCVAYDSRGNTNTCAFTVSVVDRSVPVLVGMTQFPGGQNYLLLQWYGLGTLQRSTNLTDWTDLPAAVSPYVVEQTRSSEFFRVRR